MVITTLIKNRENLNEMTLRELKNTLERFPYYHAARLLYVANLYTLHEENFSDELTKASLLVPDRTMLFNMVEGKNYQLENNMGKRVEKQDDENRTISLIDDFLSGVEPDGKDQPEQMPHQVPTIAELTTDYAAFLQMQGDELPEGQEESEQDSLINSFITQNQGKQRYQLENDESDPVGPLETTKNEDIPEQVYNENIVNIYIKQGRYQQALEILRNICLNNPEKNANFASQMKLLEIVINNNKQK